LVERGLRQENRKFLATQPRYHINFSQGVFHGAPQALQDSISHGMPVGVVDPLEIVNVEHHHGKRRLHATASGDFLIGQFIEMMSVAQPRQGVGATLRQPAIENRLRNVQSGDIIIAHMNKPQSDTAEGLSAGLLWLLRHGFTFMRLDQARLTPSP